MEYLFSENLSKLELGISKVLLANIDNLEDLSITDVSNMAYVSPATITKYTKKLGFNGFKELKYKLIYDYNKLEDSESYIIDHKNKIDNFFDNLSYERLNDLAQTIKNSQYVCFYGKGPSLGVCKYFSSRIKAVSNIPVIVYDDEQMIDIELNDINDNKTIIFLSASLETQVLLDRIRRAKTSTKNFFLICEDIHNVDKIDKNNIIKLSTLNVNHDYSRVRDRTLFYIYLELLIKTLQQ